MCRLNGADLARREARVQARRDPAERCRDEPPQLHHVESHCSHSAVSVGAESSFTGAHTGRAGACSFRAIHLASITDGLDGYLARRRRQITTIGMLLDPLADKLMVSAAYIVLVGYVPGIVPAWIATLVIGREFLVTGLRSIAAAEGFTIQASEIGKLKTVIQIVSVVAAILAHRWVYWDWGGLIIAVRLIAYTSIYWMTTVSVISAVDYFLAFWNQVDRASDTRRGKRDFLLNPGVTTTGSGTG